MAIQVCPRCKLNYVKPGMIYCKVCMNDFKDIDNDGVICPMCAVNVLAENEDLCTSCLKKRIQMSGYTIEDGNVSEDADADGDEFDGMRLVDLEADDAPDDDKEEIE